MRLLRKPSPEPLWRDEFSVFSGDEKYVSRRQFSKFLVLTSLGMFVGNLWILVRSWFSRAPRYPLTAIAHAEEIPIGGVKLFPYPTAQDQCILLRTGAEHLLFVACRVIFICFNTAAAESRDCCRRWKKMGKNGQDWTARMLYHIGESLSFEGRVRTIPAR